MYLTKGRCLTCGEPFSSYNNNPRFCSTNCWYQFRRDNNISSGSIRDYKKRSKSLKKWYKNNPLKVEKKCKKQGKTLKKKIENGEFSVERFKGRRHSEKSKKLISKKSRVNFKEQIKKKFPNKYLIPNYYSDIEMVVKKQLISLGFLEGQDFLHNNPTKTSVTVRFPDFKFPKNKTILECDGSIWHKNKNKQRDFEFEDLGFNIIHLSDSEIMRSDFDLGVVLNGC